LLRAFSRPKSGEDELTEERQKIKTSGISGWTVIPLVRRAEVKTTSRMDTRRRNEWRGKPRGLNTLLRQQVVQLKVKKAVLGRGEGGGRKTSDGLALFLLALF